MQRRPSGCGGNLAGKVGARQLRQYVVALQIIVVEGSGDLDLERHRLAAIDQALKAAVVVGGQHDLRRHVRGDLTERGPERADRIGAEHRLQSLV